MLTGSGETEKLSQKIVILGIGNILLSDEGIGVHVANELFKRVLPENVSVVEGGTDGFRLLNVITEADRLIVIDAVRGEGEPGSIYRFDIDDVKRCPSGFKTSVHQIGILEVIDLSGLIGQTPHTTIIGVDVGGARKEQNMAAVARCRHRSGREKPSINPAGDELIHKSKQICKFILI